MGMQQQQPQHPQQQPQHGRFGSQQLGGMGMQGQGQLMGQQAGAATSGMFCGPPPPQRFKSATTQAYAPAVGYLSDPNGAAGGQHVGQPVSQNESFSTHGDDAGKVYRTCAPRSVRGSLSGRLKLTLLAFLSATGEGGEGGDMWGERRPLR